MIKPSLCCISLHLQSHGHKFQTMTFKRFSSLDRSVALQILGERILNNLKVTEKIVQYCCLKNWDYRFSSSLFPLITYEQAQVSLNDLPNIVQINQAFDSLALTIKSSNVRISTHPDQFVVLASENDDAVEKSIKELNFQNWVFDRLNLPQSHESPINIHIQNKNGKLSEVVGRFVKSFDKLDESCKKRLCLENDDKTKMWSVKQLTDIVFPATNTPITFDYLHHKCHSDDLTEEEAFYRCYDTWDTKPLFHYSESRDSDNIRAHADYVGYPIKDYGLDFSCDFELKQKDYAIAQYAQYLQVTL